MVQTLTRRPVVAGNWKMNGSKALVESTLAQLKLADLSHVDVVICPPSPYWALFDDTVSLGAQNLSEFDSGAHTGEVSASMLREFGCQYVIIGHSERRADNGESNQIVASKVAKALSENLIPILCVGESEAVRDSGKLFEFIAEQLDVVVAKIGIAGFARLVLAYEPIWAIGTGKTASPQQAQEVHGFIRQHLAAQDKTIAAGIKILYGGSVKGSNARELFSQPDVDGGLIGGASLDPQDFLSICQAAKQ